LMRALPADLGGCVEMGAVQPELVAAVHPVVLHQILLSALKRLASHVLERQVELYARLEDGNVKITLTGHIAEGSAVSQGDLLGGMPIPDGVSVEVLVDGPQVFVWIEAPAMGKITVLVVDDNRDMALLYQRATLGTRYHVVHTAQGQGLWEMIKATQPDVIVLDVMLPDIDGWRLLMRLREDRATRPIPVIVCSVVLEEELALSLGAALYLSKPVRPSEFTRALDQVFGTTG